MFMRLSWYSSLDCATSGEPAYILGNISTPKILNLKIVGSPGLLFGTLTLLIALIHKRDQHDLQRLAVIGQRDQVGFVVHLLIRCKWERCITHPITLWGLILLVPAERS